MMNGGGSAEPLFLSFEDFQQQFLQNPGMFMGPPGPAGPQGDPGFSFPPSSGGGGEVLVQLAIYPMARFMGLAFLLLRLSLYHWSLKTFIILLLVFLMYCFPLSFLQIHLKDVLHILALHRLLILKSVLLSV